MIPGPPVAFWDDDQKRQGGFKPRRRPPRPKGVAGWEVLVGALTVLPFPICLVITIIERALRR